MDKKLFILGFAFVLLLVMSGFASAYTSYDYREDYKIYQYGYEPRRIDIIYIRPQPRDYHHQIGTFADFYSGYKVPEFRTISQKPRDYKSDNLRQSQDYAMYDWAYQRKMYLYRW